MEKLTFTALGALALCGLFTLNPFARAATLDEGLLQIQRDWAAIRYQTPQAEREQRFEALARRAHKLVESQPERSEPLIWEGIVVSSWAGEKGGLGALALVKQAKALYESAIRIDGNALDGSAYNSLGVLYYRVPSWPIAFGDKAKAEELLHKALAINPKGIDANYFYGEYLLDADRAGEAAEYLERALQAPPRPGREIADSGRRDEARQLLQKIRTR